MKKARCFLAFLLLAASVSVPAHEAKAGIVIWHLGSKTDGSSISGEIDKIITQGIGWGAGIVGVAGVISGLATGEWVTVGCFAGVLVLDADGNLSENNLTQNFQKAYPALDSSSASRLAERILGKAGALNPDLDGRIFVQLSRGEVESDLASSGILEADPGLFDRIARDLE